MSEKSILERCIWFDQEMRAMRYPNANRLAKRFGTVPRTAHRDLNYMRDKLHWPLQYDSSRKGYYYKADSAALPSIYLTTEELTSLIMARNFLADISGGAIGEEIESISQKINKMLNRFVGDEWTIDNALSFRVVANAPAPSAIIKPILSACLKHRRVRFSYFSPAHHEDTERTVDPYHLLNYMGSWHLIGYCHLRNALRNFNLARVADVQILDEEFVLPLHFDIHEYLDRSFGLYKSDDVDDLVDVTIRFSPEKTVWAKGRIWHPKQIETVMPDGSLEITFPVASFAEVKMEIMKHGSGIEVIKPAELREMVRKEAARVCRVYQGTRVNKK